MLGLVFALIGFGLWILGRMAKHEDRDKYNPKLSDAMIVNLNNPMHHRRFSSQYSRSVTNETSSAIPLSLLATPNVVDGGFPFSWNGNGGGVNLHKVPPRLATLDSSVWAAAAGGGTGHGVENHQRSRRGSLQESMLRHSTGVNRPMSTGGANPSLRKNSMGRRGSTRHAVSILEARNALRAKGLFR